MNKILRPRNTGKTDELILRAHKINGYLVCRSEELANEYFHKAIRNGTKINYPLTYHEFENGEYHHSVTLIIDDADALLEYISKAPIDTISMRTAQDLKNKFNEMVKKNNQLELVLD